VKILAEHIADHLSTRAFCLVFAPELERCWPSKNLARAEQEEQIEAFARSHGWSVSVLDIGYGIRAIFRREEPGVSDRVNQAND
jgi:hypothetical protein